MFKFQTEINLGDLGKVPATVGYNGRFHAIEFITLDDARFGFEDVNFSDLSLDAQNRIYLDAEFRYAEHRAETVEHYRDMEREAFDRTEARAINEAA